MAARIDRWLHALVKQDGSDLHLAAGRPPLARVHGVLQPLESAPLEGKSLRALLEEITPKDGRETYRSTGDHDFAYAVQGLARFRVNLFVQEHGPGAVLRVIPEKILSLAELKAPPVLDKLADLNGGLALVTGPTGSGKSTTMAAIVDAINARSTRHVVTIEDPLEFVHSRKRSFFSQREVGQHAKSFASALRAAVREDTDVLLVGEMRDHETIALALAAAEMGVLVFGTLHTNSASKTIARIIDAFPMEEQPQARLSLSESLAAVVAQILLPSADGRGRVAVHEILLRSPGLANLIREGNASMIANAIQAGKGAGMQTMDDALFAAASERRITPEHAFEHAQDKKRFQPLLPKGEQ
ncbi:MAG TPA: PilT/PilU family type 4a pilus ATPase [Myxococcales bacterium]